MRKGLLLVGFLLAWNLSAGLGSAGHVQPTPATYECWRNDSVPSSPLGDGCPHAVFDVEDAVVFENDACHDMDVPPASVACQFDAAVARVTALGGIVSPAVMFSACIEAGDSVMWSPNSAPPSSFPPTGTTVWLVEWYSVDACNPITGQPLGSLTFEKGYDPACTWQSGPHFGDC